MFKSGDKIVCKSNKYEEKRLVLNKIYTFKCYEFNKIMCKTNYNTIEVYENDIWWIADRFVPITEVRKQKLQKIIEDNGR